MIKRSIPRLERVTKEEVETLLEGAGTPFVLTDTLRGQPAFEKWSFDWFIDRYGDDVVEASDHLDDASVRVRTTLKTYLEYAMDSGAGPLANVHGHASLYAYGYQPFEKHPELLADIADPACIDNMLSTIDPALRAALGAIDGQPAGRWCFMGPEATVASLHTDYSAAWLAQIQGRKLCHLYGPDQTPYLYDGAVDPLEVDLARYPAIAQATAWVGVLEPGDTLVMPQDWWHHVVALEPSITVSFNFVTKQNFGRWLSDLVSDLQPVDIREEKAA